MYLRPEGAGMFCLMHKVSERANLRDYLKTGLPFLAALAALTAISLAILVPREKVIPAFALHKTSGGSWATSATLYGYTPETLPEVVGQDGQRFLRSTIQTESEFSGFGIVVNLNLEGSTLFRIRWRVRGTTDFIRIGLREKTPGGTEERFYDTEVRTPPLEWTTTRIPVSAFIRGSSSEPDTAAEGTLHGSSINGLAFTVPPNSDVHVEIASVEFVRPGRKWMLVTVFGAMAFGAIVFRLILQFAPTRRRHATTLQESETDAEESAGKDGFGLALGRPENRRAGCFTADGLVQARFIRYLQLGLLYFTALSAVSALVVGCFLPARRAIPAFDPRESEGASGLSKTILSNSSKVALEFAEDKGGRFLRSTIQKEPIYSGFRIISPVEAMSGSFLRIRWRAEGGRGNIQVEIHERGAGDKPEDIFSALIGIPPPYWITTEMPLSAFAWNEYANSHEPLDLRLDYGSVNGIGFTFEPDSDLRLDVASVEFVAASQKWLIIAILSAVAIGALGCRQFLLLVLRRRWAERTLLVSEARYEAIFDAVREGILVLDPETGRVLDANETACEIFGYARDEFLNHNTRCLEWMAKALSSEERGFEWSGETAQGDTLWVEIRLSKAEISGKLQVLALIRDVRDRKKAEHEREGLEAQLLRSQKMEAVGRLAGGVAHDFNNLLTGITCSCEMSRSQLEPESDMARTFTRILQFANRAARLTRQLLTFSRQQPMKQSVVSANELLRNALSLLERVIGEDVRLEFKGHADPDTILADTGQIEQVLMNLAVNARDAMPEGGTLAVLTENVFLDETASVNLEAGEYLSVKVTDTGQGLSDEIKARVFEPFFTTKDVGKGTGLGLSTVYGIVHQHHGDVSLESALGQGTTFTILLPIVRKHQEQESLQPIATATQGNETIFVVEDDEAVRSLVVEVLRSQGYRVLWADSPAEADRLFPQHQHEVDLLLTDVVMPGESGPELYKRLKSRYPDLRVLFMSGYADQTALNHEVLEQEHLVVPKPFRPAQLGNMVRKALDHCPVAFARQDV